MIAQCDYVVVAAPLTPETRGMIGAAEFAAMKPDGGGDQRGPRAGDRRSSAMIAALQKGRIRGAALDVFDQEPLPAGHPFYRLENVLLSPHCADHTPDWLEQAMQFFLTSSNASGGRTAEERDRQTSGLLRGSPGITATTSSYFIDSGSSP